MQANTLTGTVARPQHHPGLGLRRLAAIVAPLLLLACAASPEPPPPVAQATPLHDHAFPGFDAIPVESEEEVFYLDDAARAFVHETMAGKTDPFSQMEALAYRIFDRSEFNLLYMADANTTAAQTFHNRAANCLSMSIMTYAMGQEAGFRVRFRDVQVPEYWTRRGGTNVRADHLNLILMPRIDPEMVRLMNDALIVDFDPQPGRSPYPSVVVGKPRVLAMFYNNKGADALLNGDNTRAYAYFRAALKTDPLFDSPWVNLGYLYRLEGREDYAEASYLEALRIDPDNLSAWENLGRLYELKGQYAAADAIAARVDKARASNPYYHFILGEEALESNRFAQAIDHYERAITLDASKHEFYFGLAKAHYELGDVARSELYLGKAKRQSKSRQERELYQGKLDMLATRSLAPIQGS